MLCNTGRHPPRCGCTTSVLFACRRRLKTSSSSSMLAGIDPTAAGSWFNAATSCRSCFLVSTTLMGTAEAAALPTLSLARPRASAAALRDLGDRSILGHRDRTLLGGDLGSNLKCSWCASAMNRQYCVSEEMEFGTWRWTSVPAVCRVVSVTNYIKDEASSVTGVNFINILLSI